MKTRLLNKFLVPVVILLLFACNSKKTNKDPNVLKQELINVEKEFETAAKNKGIPEAFYYYADEEAVILRENNTLIKGKENIKEYYQKRNSKNVVVNWAPDFEDVSADGTLGHTYGKFIWKTTDSLGKISEFKGVFHTVWKRQLNGDWKYVWD